MQIGYHISRAGGLLEHILFGTPDIVLLNSFKIRQQLAIIQQLVDGIQCTVNRAVINQAVGITRSVIKCLHLHVHGGQCIFVHIQIFCGENIGSAGQLNHFGNIISGLAHVDISVGADVKKCHGFSCAVTG